MKVAAIPRARTVKLTSIPRTTRARALPAVSWEQGSARVRGPGLDRGLPASPSSQSSSSDARGFCPGLLCAPSLSFCVPSSHPLAFDKRRSPDHRNAPFENCVSIFGLRKRARPGAGLHPPEQLGESNLDLRLGDAPLRNGPKSTIIVISWFRLACRTMRAVVAWGCVHAASMQGDCYSGSA